MLLIEKATSVDLHRAIDRATADILYLRAKMAARRRIRVSLLFARIRWRPRSTLRGRSFLNLRFAFVADINALRRAAKRAGKAAKAKLFREAFAARHCPTGLRCWHRNDPRRRILRFLVRVIAVDTLCYALDAVFSQRTVALSEIDDDKRVTLPAAPLGFSPSRRGSRPSVPSRRS